MTPTADEALRQQQLYWNELTELMVQISYIRRYRDSLGRRVTILGTLKAVASCGSIAAWAIWKQYAFVWGLIIAASQLADALKDVFPFSKQHLAASVQVMALTTLFVDAQLEWENIHAGQYTDEEIMTKLHKLRKLQLESEKQSFPNGLAIRRSLRNLAQQDARQYFQTAYKL